MAIHLIVVKIFQLHGGAKVTKASKIYPLGNMNIYIYKYSWKSILLTDISFNGIFEYLFSALNKKIRLEI